MTFWRHLLSFNFFDFCQDGIEKSPIDEMGTLLSIHSFQFEQVNFENVVCPLPYKLIFFLKDIFMFAYFFFRTGKVEALGICM